MDTKELLKLQQIGNVGQ